MEEVIIIVMDIHSAVAKAMLEFVRGRRCMVAQDDLLCCAKSGAEYKAPSFQQKLLVSNVSHLHVK